MYECTLCGKRFKTSATWKSHQGSRAHLSAVRKAGDTAGSSNNNGSPTRRLPATSSLMQKAHRFWHNGSKNRAIATAFEAGLVLEGMHDGTAALQAWRQCLTWQGPCAAPSPPQPSDAAVCGRVMIRVWSGLWITRCEAESAPRAAALQALQPWWLTPALSPVCNGATGVSAWLAWCTDQCQSWQALVTGLRLTWALLCQAWGTVFASYQARHHRSPWALQASKGFCATFVPLLCELVAHESALEPPMRAHVATLAAVALDAVPASLAPAWMRFRMWHQAGTAWTHKGSSAPHARRCAVHAIHASACIRGGAVPGDAQDHDAARALAQLCEDARVLSDPLLAGHTLAGLRRSCGGPTCDCGSWELFQGDTEAPMPDDGPVSPWSALLALLHSVARGDADNVVTHWWAHYLPPLHAPSYLPTLYDAATGTLLGINDEG